LVACDTIGWERTRTDLSVHLSAIPKYLKPVLTGKLAVRVRAIVRRIAFEHLARHRIGEGRTGPCSRPRQLSSDAACEPDRAMFKGISSRVLLQENPRLRKLFWDRHFCARGYLAVTSGTVTEDMMQPTSRSKEGSPLTKPISNRPMRTRTNPPVPVTFSGSELAITG
jgi:putative transposase